ncbi:MAG TPA: CheR family methyltransferase [Candidatus Limnocylindrales bacterium]|nr:CheR family methyltransferase [Candidatus Limnocylindrales bacterium]
MVKARPAAETGRPAARVAGSEAQLVVIGSSAGGIEALSRVVAGLSPDFPAPVVIAQHLDPRRPSHLGEILTRHATLPIRVVEEEAALEEGVIFVVPSNRQVEIVDHTVRLRPARRGSVAPSVDLLLESAARAYGPGLTAVILTGTGSDGSAGAWHVKEAGGTVVIENPETAAFPSMPGSIPPTLVDATADVDAIGRVLRDILASAGSTPEWPDGDEFGALLQRIRDHSGIDFSSYKPATIERRLRGRMSATSQPSMAAYARYLEGHPAEYARLISSLLIKVTEFFRDPKVFQYLRERTLPALIEQARADGQELRVWSAGCSTGEEAYSLAITIAEAYGGEAPPAHVRVFATDIDHAAVAFARRGIYAPGALKSVAPAILARYFDRSDGWYEVAKPLRSMMIFGEHDLGARAPFPRIDLVLCRNVLIYFTPAMQRTALETFAFSLREGGLLVLGPSETVAAMPDLFAEDNARLRVYRRLPGESARKAWPMATRARRDRIVPLDRAIRATRREVDREADSSASADRLLLQLASGIVVVDPRYYIMRINTAARRLLGIHGKAFEQDFIHLAEALPSNALRASIDAALAGKNTTAVHEVEAVDLPRDASRFVQVMVHPYRGEGGAIEGAVIELSDASQSVRDRLSHSHTVGRMEKAVAVNRRILHANEELTALVAELRTANQMMLRSSEEAQAGREEVETLNEEFQASNEELEALNEELTASVEELRIANEDLAARTADLRLQAVALEAEKHRTEEERDRLRSVLASLGDAVLAVDHAGRTVATNVAYDRLFGGPEAEIRPEDLAGIPLPAHDWPQQRAARGEQFRMQFAVSTPNGARRWFEAVAEPLTAEDRTWGGVVAIRDLSEHTMRLTLERLMGAAGHELKTPAAAIHNYLQLVDRQLAAGDAGKAAMYAARALSQTRRLGALVERLLDVSRIHTGQLELLLETVDLAAAAAAAVEVAAVLPNAPPIRFSAPDGAVHVRADPARLEQVFLNLLTNAIEHAPGSPTIEVAVRRKGRRAEVEVRDRGDGVPSESLATIFEAYTRHGDPHRTGGLGLGLFVAREIVTAHGGEIAAVSGVGEGMVMTVRLPVAPAPARRRAGRPSSAGRPSGRAG